GTLASAVLGLADRLGAPGLVAAGTLVAAALNAAIPLSGAGPAAAMLLRMGTGAALAGVYPPGMKLVASWFKSERGFGIGVLIGALTLGSSLPHLMNALPLAGGMPPWRPMLLVASGLALAGGLLAAVAVRSGPHLARSAPFDWRLVGRILADRPTRLAN